MPPIKTPSSSTTPTQPNRFSDITGIASRIATSFDASGKASPSCIRSATRSKLFPILPPGCRTRKSCGENPFRSRRATASASPIASDMVVDVVGARPIGHASGIAGRSNTTSASSVSVLPAPEVITINGIEKRRVYSAISRSSGVSPEFESARTASSHVTIPRSPWLASPGWT